MASSLRRTPSRTRSRRLSSHALGAGPEGDNDHTDLDDNMSVLTRSNSTSVGYEESDDSKLEEAIEKIKNHGECFKSTFLPLLFWSSIYCFLFCLGSLLIFMVLVSPLVPSTNYLWDQLVDQLPDNTTTNEHLALRYLPFFSS